MKNTMLVTTLLSGAVLGLSACGGGGGGGDDGGDSTPPVITITGGNVSIVEGTAYTDAGASAIDDVDGAIVPAATGTVDVNTPGVYTITYTATDSAGNTSTAIRTVSVGVFNTFDGKWKSECTSGTANSFDQIVTITGTDVTSNINVYLQVNCQGAAIPASAVTIFDYQGEVDVPAGCDTGKAEKVDASIVSVTALGQTLTNEAAIRTQLTSLGIDVVPEFNLLCLGNGRLLSGDISGTNDGSTDALRPDSMDLSGFTKI